MSIITRKDGIKFAINNYREAIVVKKTGLLKKELRLLGDIHGKFAKFYYKDGQQSLETIFSPEQGYLLGLAVWAHFGKKSPNLIYCEALSDSDNALLVIIHGGGTYLETELHKASIVTELASLLLLDSTLQFDIYIHGDVPIAQTPTEGKFAFETSMIKTFNVLEKPLFPTLAVDIESQLVPIEQAIKELNLPGSYTLPILGILGGLVVVGYFWKTLHPKEAAELTPIVEASSSYLDPYKQLQIALSTPAPSQIVTQINHHINDLLSMHNWIPTHIAYQNKLLTVSVSPIAPGTTFYDLMRWAYRHGYKITPSSRGATLTQTLNLPNRVAEEGAINPATSIYSFIYDRLENFFPYQALIIKTIKPYTGYQEIQLSITMQNASNAQLRQLTQVFRNEPVAIQNIDLTFQHGLLTGLINFSILGI